MNINLVAKIANSEIIFISMLPKECIPQPWEKITNLKISFSLPVLFFTQNIKKQDYALLLFNKIIIIIIINYYNLLFIIIIIYNTNFKFIFKLSACINNNGNPNSQNCCCQGDYCNKNGTTCANENLDPIILENGKKIQPKWRKYNVKTGKLNI